MSKQHVYLVLEFTKDLDNEKNVINETRVLNIYSNRDQAEVEAAGRERKSGGYWRSYAVIEKSVQGTELTKFTNSRKYTSTVWIK